MTIIYCPDTGESAMTYRGYQTTAHWKALRYRKYHQQRTCERCGREIDGDFEMHHLHYKTLGAESLEDVAVLHPSCHAANHDIQDSRWKRYSRTQPVGAFADAIIDKLQAGGGAG